MRSSVLLQRGLAAGAATLTSLGLALTLAGCEGGGGASSVSSSTEEATVHGTVKYKGQLVTEGEVRFDPSNVSRRMATAAVGPIGKDGTYTVKTLVGENAINFNLPKLAKSDANPGYATVHYDVL